MLESLAVYFCACFALSGVGVGLAGLFPRFIYENPAHRASMWALMLGFVFATAYLIVGGLIAALAYLGVTRGGLAVEWRPDAVRQRLRAGVAADGPHPGGPGDPPAAGLRVGIRV